jgi:hypothetical protein
MVSVRVVLAVVLIALSAPADGAEAVFYDGVFDIGNKPVARYEEAKLRKWVWTRWHERRPGSAILKWVTVEGDSGTTEYTIAKSRDGAWYLSIHLQGSDRTAPEDGYWRDTWLIAYSVTRTERPYLDEAHGKPIRPSRQLSPRHYALELTDRQGKVITHF